MQYLPCGIVLCFRNKDIVINVFLTTVEGLSLIIAFSVTKFDLVETTPDTSLFQEDLVHTIGESAALGAAGVILWGGYEYSASKVSNDFSVSNLNTLLRLV